MKTHNIASWGTIKLKAKEIARLETENNKLKEQIRSSIEDIESENNKLKEKAEEKDDAVEKSSSLPEFFQHIFGFRVLF